MILLLAIPAALAVPQAVAERARDPENGRSYVRTPEPLAFADAERIARQMGGMLLSLQSAEEETFVLDNFGAGEAYWLGLEFPRTHWADGTALVYAHWAEGQPGATSTSPYTLLNWSEPGAWGVPENEGDQRYRALIEFPPGVEPGIVPPLGIARRARRGVLLVALQGLSRKELENTRLPNLHGLFERGAWSEDAGGDPSGDPLAGLGMLTWGVGSSRSRLDRTRPEQSATDRNENVLSRLERTHPDITTVALFDDPSLSGILLDGRIDLRLPNVSARHGGDPAPLADALARPTPLCILSTFTALALRDEEASEAARSKEIAAIDRELGELLAALQARPQFAQEEWWIAVAGLAPPPAKKGKAPEGRARTAVPLVLVAPDVPPGELRCEVSLADLVPSAMQFLEVPPRANAGFDGRVLDFTRRAELGANLLFNPGAEEQQVYDTGSLPLLPGWRTLEPFRAARNGARAEAAPELGVNHFAGQGETRARIEQLVDLTALASEIDRGGVRFTLAGLLGSRDDSPATIELSLEFLNEAQKSMESAGTGPVGPEQRRTELGAERGRPQDGLVPRSVSGKVPKRARMVRVVLLAQGPRGVGKTMADALSLVLTHD